MPSYTFDDWDHRNCQLQGTRVSGSNTRQALNQFFVKNRCTRNITHKKGGAAI